MRARGGLVGYNVSTGIITGVASSTYATGAVTATASSGANENLEALEEAVQMVRLILADLAELELPEVLVARHIRAAWLDPILELSHQHIQRQVL